MTGRRSDRDLHVAIDSWMHEAAPRSAPVSVLEEAFARTMVARQARVYPWERLVRRSSHPRGLTLLTVAATAILLIAVLGLGVLGGGSGVGPGPRATGTPTPTPVPSESPSPSPPAVIPIPIVPTANIVVSRPLGIATDGTAVWILTETGLVQRIDPATNLLGPGTQTGATTDLYNDISADRNGVWVTDWGSASLYHLDPATARVVAVIDASPAPKGVIATGSAVWVAATHDGKVLRIDPATNEVVATVVVGPPGTSGPNWLAIGLGSVWVDIPNNQTVVRIDPITNAIQATIDIPRQVPPCGGFAITPTVVWNTTCDGPQAMTRIDPATNVVVTTVSLAGQGYSPAVINGASWVSIDPGPDVPGTLGRISPATNAIDLRLSPGGGFVGGSDMVVAAGSVWVIDNGNGRILRLPLSEFTPG
jgi:streptogramin lyase